MIFNFSTGARSVLLSLGWSESRSVDIGEVVSKLSQREYAIHDFASTILRAFVGLYITNQGAYSFDCSDPALVGRVFVRNQLVELNPRLFADLYPIGTTVLACIFVSKDGMIYSVDCDRYSWHTYRSFERMIDVVLRIEQSTPEERYVPFVAKDQK
jgi:hypothetical protein